IEKVAPSALDFNRGGAEAQGTEARRRQRGYQEIGLLAMKPSQMCFMVAYWPLEPKPPLPSARSSSQKFLSTSSTTRGTVPPHPYARRTSSAQTSRACAKSYQRLH